MAFHAVTKKYCSATALQCHSITVPPLINGDDLTYKQCLVRRHGTQHNNKNMTLDILERYAEWCFAERRYIFNFLLSVVTLSFSDVFE
jgi:hypothetical protein